MKEKIGFIGTGVMGASMVKHLLAAGYEVGVYNRTKEKAQQLLDQGAKWFDSPAELAGHSTTILSIVGFPQDVEEIYFGEAGVFRQVKADSLLIDLTTSTPTLAKKIAQKSLEMGCMSLDAPVSGGDVGAKNGTLSIMVGGTQVAFDRALPMLETFGKSISLQGDAGAGQHTKMANQIMIAGTMTGLVESLVYARKAGLDPEKVLETVGAGSAANWSLSNYGPRILKGDFQPGFFVKHFLKDLRIALDESEKMELPLPATREAARLYTALVEAGYGNDGTQALVKLWDLNLL